MGSRQTWRENDGIKREMTERVRLGKKSQGNNRRKNI